MRVEEESVGDEMGGESHLLFLGRSLVVERTLNLPILGVRKRRGVVEEGE